MHISIKIFPLCTEQVVQSEAKQVRYRSVRLTDSGETEDFEYEKVIEQKIDSVICKSDIFQCGSLIFKFASSVYAPSDTYGTRRV